jgi:uncharacterized protein (DUF362 family)/sugar phosphate isomerase/epimerase
MTSRYRVAVVKVEEIAPAVQRALDLMGGLERWVKPGALVVLKVNMFTRATPEEAKATHPGVILAVARLCHQLGARVAVVERTPQFAYDFQGYEAIHEVAELVNLDDAEHTHRTLPGARSLIYQVPWPRLLDNCDVFINIPGLRTHSLTKFSNGMKNLMGLMPSLATRFIHQFGLDGSICDLNSYRPSDLTITDAIYTVDGNFPAEGGSVRTNILTVADNVVAADLVGARILGEDPQEAFYLQEAIRRGMGPASAEELELVGDPLPELLQGVRIQPAPRHPEQLAQQLGFRLLAKSICETCQQALAGGLLATSHRPELARLKGVTIISGPQESLPDDLSADKVLVYGNCAYRHRHLGHYEPGCPPLAGQVASGLTAMLPRTLRAAMCSIAWREAPLEQALPIIAAAGYNGVEIWGPHLERWEQEHGGLETLASALRELGLQVPMISGYYDLVKDLPGSLATARRYLAYARILGAPLLRVFTGGGDSALATIPLWRAVVSGLGELCALGRAQGVGMALETHQGHLHDTTASTLRLIRQVGMDNLYVNLDIYNLFMRGEEPVRALKRLLPWVRILHLKSGRQERKFVGAPLAESDMDYPALLRALAEANYGGYVSIEWFGGHPEAAAPQELAFLRQQLGDKLEARAVERAL